MLTPRDMLRLSQPHAELTIPYGDGGCHVGDLRLPEGVGPFGLALLLHGGCWESFVDRTHLGRFAEALRARGVASLNIEYRRVGDEGGGWPGTFDDVRAAIASRASLARAHPVDLSRVILVGHSAGAQLALWYASAVPEATQLCAVMALAPITDLRREHLRGPCARAAGALVRGAAGDDDSARRRLSPALIAPPRVPVTLVRAALDEVVDASHCARYLDAHRDGTRELALDGCGHFELITPGNAACEEVVARIEALVGAAAPRHG